MSSSADCLQSKFQDRLSRVSQEILEEATERHLDIWRGDTMEEDYLHGITPLEAAIRAFNESLITLCDRAQKADELLRHRHVWGDTGCLICPLEQSSALKGSR